MFRVDITRLQTLQKKIGDQWIDDQKKICVWQQTPAQQPLQLLSDKEISEKEEKRFEVDQRARSYAIKYVNESLYPKWLREKKRDAKDKRLIQVPIEKSPVFKMCKSKKKIATQDMIDDVCASLKLRYNDVQNQMVVPKTFELFDNSVYANVTCKGDEAMSGVRRTLDEFGLKRHANQIYFHEQMLRACLRKVYQFDYEQNIDRVLKENNWPKMVQEVLVITARRMGNFSFRKKNDQN